MDTKELDHQYIIDGIAYNRLPYDRAQVADSIGATIDDIANPCHDCDAADGELHTKGCDMEVCPACDGQRLQCILFGGCKR